ncbi:MAG: hemerythrin domain-containing protein [Deltaproteobacteria bacterium]|nr:hemerythrin domain-containing protein [Deltaproteobacteria bacterium]
MPTGGTSLAIDTVIDKTEQPEGIVQFFQHAHHRIEGWLMEFQEALDDSRVDAPLIERAAETLRLHMYAEEEIVFPSMQQGLRSAIADLQRQHGRLSDLMAELLGLVRDGADVSRVRRSFSLLNNALAAHCAAEDLGIYPDLLSTLGPAAARALLRAADQAELPSGWICEARRATPRPRRIARRSATAEKLRHRRSVGRPRPPS